MGFLENIHSYRNHFVQNMKDKAGNLIYDNRLYNWSLNWPLSTNAPPPNFIMSIPDPWKGCAQRGKWICEGDFELEGNHLELTGFCWEPFGVEDSWIDHMHSFSWLRDLRTLGGEKGRSHARAFVHNWIAHYPRWSAINWTGKLLGSRLSYWISHYDFFGASGNEDFQEEFFESVYKQAKHLSHALNNYETGLDKLYACKGLVYSGLALKGREQWLEQGLTILKEEAEKQILSDGGHISRSPQQLFETINIFVDIRLALLVGNYPIPPFIQHGLDRMVPALRFFRMADKKLSLFQGAQHGEEELIDNVLSQANIRAKTLKSLPQTGFERANIGRSQIIFETGTPAKFPYDKKAHASPLSFEFCYGKERIFTNCGAHPTEKKWNEALRNTPAHSTLTIDDRNAVEIMADGHFGRRMNKNITTREEWDGAILIETAHDGYSAINGITHQRRLYLTEDGHDFRGEDTLRCSIGLNKAHNIDIRFHLHPRVLASLVREGSEVLLRLTSGAGWRFYASMDGLVSGNIKLEDSIYLGEGSRPIKTKQIVLSGIMKQDEIQIKWALQREGL